LDIAGLARRVIVLASDASAEAPDARGLVLGVQWHPEELVGHDPAARALFGALMSPATV
jgi:gamma-glutamyl-gamma-aminobutyrate hydrolase PuuD